MFKCSSCILALMETTSPPWEPKPWPMPWTATLRLPIWSERAWKRRKRRGKMFKNRKIFDCLFSVLYHFLLYAYFYSFLQGHISFLFHFAFSNPPILKYISYTALDTTTFPIMEPRRWPMPFAPTPPWLLWSEGRRDLSHVCGNETENFRKFSVLPLDYPFHSSLCVYIL